MRKRYCAIADGPEAANAVWVRDGNRYTLPPRTPGVLLPSGRRGTLW
jgi:hypothetical protein